MKSHFSLTCLDTNQAQDLNTPVISIGRGENADWTIPDRDMSREHAKLFNSSEVITLVDMASRNGTFLNQEKISQPTAITSGDIIQMGNTVFKVHEEDLNDPTILANSASITLLGHKARKKNKKRSPNFLGLFPFLNHNIHSTDTSFKFLHAKTISNYINHFNKVIGSHSSIVLFTYTQNTILAIQCLTCNEPHKWTIGRSDDCFITISDPSISKYHAELKYRNNAWEILDTGSKNGIRLDGTHFEQRHLEDEDDLRLGDIKIFVRLINSDDD